jgi:hypothetical protein
MGLDMKLFFDDQNFDGQLQRSVGKADAGMANVGECLAIAAQITGGDRDSWYQAWSIFGLGLVEQADTALAAGHRVSARSAYRPVCEPCHPAFGPRSTSGRRSSSTGKTWTATKFGWPTPPASLPSERPCLC